jgi:hypothetical protein
MNGYGFDGYDSIPGRNRTFLFALISRSSALPVKPPDRTSSK